MSVVSPPPPPPPPPLNNPVRFPVENRRMEHSPANGEFCMYNGAEQHSPESNDGFQRNKRDTRKQKRREEQRIKTIYGTRNAPHSRISGNQLVKTKLYDLFVPHINGDATLYDIREYNLRMILTVVTCVSISRHMRQLIISHLD